MTLFGTILKKVQSKDSIAKKYSSPPPEGELVNSPKKKKKPVNKYARTPARVDAASPALRPRDTFRRLASWSAQLANIHRDNVLLVTAIKRQHFQRGKVDCRWSELPPPCLQYYHERRGFLARVQSENQHLYHTLVTTSARVATAESLSRDWARNRRQMIQGAANKFVLFEPVPRELVEDNAFKPPEGVTRPRVYMQLAVGAASLGELAVELFTEACPHTCQLFLELLAGDGLGHGYVGTCFFTKVPGLYWAGGDVIHDNGFGCYAQRGRRAPRGAENYHFSHSMPGLLSMRMTADDEMCGCFNITFKALPQFDLRNVVFGRVVRPCSTFNTMRQLGSPLSTRPRVAVSATRPRRAHAAPWAPRPHLAHAAPWAQGQPNTRLTRIRY